MMERRKYPRRRTGRHFSLLDSKLRSNYTTFANISVDCISHNVEAIIHGISVTKLTECILIPCIASIHKEAGNNPGRNLPVG